MITTYFGLYEWSVWGTPFIPSHFSPGAWFWGVFASLIFLLLVLITAKDQICEHRPKCVFSCRKNIKNGLRGVRNGVRKLLRRYWDFLGVREFWVFPKENLTPRCSQRCTQMSSVRFPWKNPRIQQPVEKRARLGTRSNF